MNALTLLWHQASPMAWKEWVQLRRDKPLMAFLVVLPLAQLLVMGLAIQNEIKNLPTLVYLQDAGNPALEVVKALQANSTFKVTVNDPSIHSSAEAVEAVKEGRYKAGVVVPPNFSRVALRGQETPTLGVVLDGTNANMSKTVIQALQKTLSAPLGYGALNASTGRGLVKTPLFKGLPGASSSLGLSTTESITAPLSSEGLSPSLAAGGIGSQWFRALPQVQILNNPELSAPLFLIPGILGLIMHILTVLLSSFSLVRERETGTLEPLLVTPLEPLPLMLGKLLPYAVIGVIDMALALGLIISFFGLGIPGSLGFLALSSLVFIATSLALGLVFSVVCATQVQALQLTLGLLLPSLMLSGFVFPVQPMPWFIKAISYGLPLTYYLQVSRGVLVQGLGFEQLWPNLLVLASMGLVCVGLSLWGFKKQITS